MTAKPPTVIALQIVQKPPERGDPLDRALLGARRWRENAPAVDEELGKAGIGAGIFGAGDRMGGHEVDAGRKVRGHVPHDRSFDRADVRHD